ncbi:MAG TPA: alpha/beta hydrolase [Candidatus Eisenbacteria bacterium]
MSITPVEESVYGTGGRLFVRSWSPVGPPRAILAICHGFNSHSGQYDWVAQQFTAAGYAVYAMDLRGRGKSEGERFFVDHIDEYVSDLSTLIQLARQRAPGLKVFLLGHSAGGVISCTYTLDYQKELAGLICESFAFRVPAPKLALDAIKGISSFAPRLPVLTLHNKDFSRDPAAVAALDADPLIAHETQPAETVAALWRADERLTKEFPKIHIPVFIMHGTHDKATVPAGSQFFYDTVGSTDKTLRMYQDHFHDLFNDVGKETVMADTLAWVAARL